jgi:UTP:GlnB (protein PII) uridylyltransferase
VEQLDTVYFLRQSAEEIAWHARALHDCVESDQPVVKARLNPFGEGLEVMVYTHDQADLFCAWSASSAAPVTASSTPRSTPRAWLRARHLHPARRLRPRQ